MQKRIVSACISNAFTVICMSLTNNNGVSDLKKVQNDEKIELISHLQLHKITNDSQNKWPWTFHFMKIEKLLLKLLKNILQFHTTYFEYSSNLCILSKNLQETDFFLKKLKFADSKNAMWYCFDQNKNILKKKSKNRFHKKKYQWQIKNEIVCYYKK